MDISISNIAWNVCDDLKIATLLNERNVKAIDIAPTKYFPAPEDATFSDIDKIRRFWSSKDIKIIGMQSLLYGRNEFNIFGSKNIQDDMLKYLSKICFIGSELGAVKLVFGSPKNRDRVGIDIDKANDIAYEFFNRLGDIAYELGVTICLEPNPEVYGCNFLTNSDETISLVKRINHPSIKFQLDIGAIKINNESLSDILTKAVKLVGHIHISEPNLSILGDCGYDHRKTACLINDHMPSALGTIEMLIPKNEDSEKAISRAINFIQENYLNLKVR
ncbi:sugar phosphate isomerase/epimerase family protein [Vibrio cholerae]